MNRSILFLIALAFVTVSTADARPVEPPIIEEPQAFTETGPSTGGVLAAAAQDSIYFGGTTWAADSLRWEAIPGGIWTFDSGVGSHYDHGAPWVNPYKDVTLHAYMEGWVGFDASVLAAGSFRRVSLPDFEGGTACVGTDAGMSGSYSLWAGVLPSEVAASCFVRQGYGNSWNVSIARTFEYAGGSVTLTYWYNSDTEPSYDFVDVYTDPDPAVEGDEVLVTSYTGPASGMESFVLDEATYFPSGPGTVAIRFRVTSDNSWSDEDGLYASTCGAFALDDISITGGISYSTDFESDADGWVVLPAAPGQGDFSDIVDLASYLGSFSPPDPLPPCPCGVSDSVLVMKDPVDGTLSPGFLNLAISPWIDLERAGAAGRPGKFIELDLHANLPPTNDVFYTWFVQCDSTACGTPTTREIDDWRGTDTIYSVAGPTCRKARHDVSALVPPGVKQVRVALAVEEADFDSYQGDLLAKIAMDNVRFGVYGTTDAPLLSTNPGDRPQDAFPDDGTASFSSPVRVDCNTLKGTSTPQPLSALGDTLVVRGGLGTAEVRVVFAVHPGPGVDRDRLGAWLTRHQPEGTALGLDWYSARMDTAQNGLLNPSAGIWMTAYHELDPNFTGKDTDLDPADLNPRGGQSRLLNDIFPDDLFTPGTRLLLYYKARYTGGSSWFFHPDWTAGQYFELEGLPSSMADDGTHNKVLYVDHYDSAEGQSIIENALRTVLPASGDNFEGVAWDRWDTQAPTLNRLSLGRPPSTEYGANAAQLRGYDLIIWNSGANTTYNLSAYDADVLKAWLTDGSPSRGLYLNGNDLAWSMGSISSALNLLNLYCGAARLCTSVRQGECPGGSVEDLTACMPVEAAVSPHFTSGSAVGRGNGCMDLYNFDVLGLSPLASGEALGNLTYEGPVKGTAEYASISHFEADPPSYRTVVDGFSLHTLRDPDCTGRDAVADRLAAILDWVNPDTDGDGIPNELDACPTVATGIGELDRDLDGCPDPTSSFRFVRFWNTDQIPISYETDAEGDPANPDGSDFAALSAGFAAWTAVPGVVLAGGDDLTRAGPSIVTAGDRRNSISFTDPAGFLFGTLAIAPTTVAVEDTTIGGRDFRAGEIVDVDIMFNTRDFSFATPTYDPGPGAFDLRSLATHEFGHLFGFSHTPAERSTMFYVLPRGTGAASLEADDLVLARRGYASPEPALALEGRVLRPDGTTPVAGAAVFALADATGDTLQMTISGMDGVYRLYEVGESHRVYVLPIDGSSAVNYLTAGAVNSVLGGVAETDFLPEYWDEAGESNADFAGTGFVVIPGAPVTGADIILNVDQDPPQVVATTPGTGETAALTTGALLVLFDEKLDAAAFRSDPDIHLRNLDLDLGVGGSAALLQENRLISFIPSVPLAYDTNYELRIGPDLYDLSGNSMAAEVLVAFHTEVQPPVSLASASPSELPIGGVLVLSGAGFDPIPSGNLVTFAGGVSVHPIEAAPDRISVPVPIGSISGDVTVQRGPLVSNPLPITVVLPLALPVGNVVEEVALSQEARSLDISPDGSTAWVATSAGVTSLPAIPTDPGFLQPTLTSIAGGAVGVVALATGDGVLAAATDPPRLCLIDPATKLVVAEVPLVDSPLALAEVPGGREVIVAYQDRVVLHGAAPGPLFGQELREWSLYGLTFGNRVAVSPTGREAYAVTRDNLVAVLGLGAGEGIVAYLEGSSTARGIAGAFDGSRVLTAEWGGAVGIYGVRGPGVEVLNFQGGLSSVVMAPDGTYAYVANFVNNRIEVINVSGAATVPVGGFSTGIDPIDVKTGSGGRYVYALCAEGDQLWVYDTTAGPRLASVSPPAGGPGALITLAGSGFDPTPANNTVSIGDLPQVPIAVSADGTSLILRQSAGGGGETVVSVRTAGLVSNVLPYRVVDRPDAGNLFPTGSLAAGVSEDFVGVLESPDGGILVALHGGGGASALRADPSAGDLLRPIQTLASWQTGMSTPGAMVFTPDSRKLYAVNGTAIAVFDVVSGASEPLTRSGDVVEGGVPAVLGAVDLAITPDGRRLLARSAAALHEIDVATDEVLSTITVFTGAPASLALGREGSLAFVGDLAGGTPVIDLVDIDPTSATYRQLLSAFPLGAGNAPTELVTSPDGRRLSAVYYSSTDGQYRLVSLDVEAGSPTWGTVVASTLIGTAPPPRLLVNRSGTVVYLVTLGASFETRALRSDTLAPLTSTGPHAGIVALSPPSISRDDARLYTGQAAGAIHVVDAATVTEYESVSGFEQPAVAGASLPSPLVVRVASTGPAPAEGSVVRFSAGDGNFGYPDRTALAVVDGDNFASVSFTAGPAAGIETIIMATSAGSWSEPLTVVPDTTLTSPTTLAVTPADMETVGSDTRIAVDFSKAIKPATVNSGTYFVRAPGGPAVPGFYSFAESGRRVVFTPNPVLAYGGSYEIVITSGLTDYNDHPLEDPGMVAFQTAPQPQPTLSALDPPAAKVGTPLVLSGEGFSAMPAENTILFGSRTAPVLAGEPGWLVTSVPLDAQTGPVQVSVNGTLSNAQTFTVLVPDPDFLNLVTASVEVPVSGQAVVVTPDGARAYMTSPGSNSVVPIVIPDRISETPISTGKYPFGAAVSPSGDRVYVTNFYSNSISVIDADPAHPTFQKVLATILTGIHPTAVAVHPDGRSLYVVHYGDNQLLTVDTDSTSASQYYARSAIDTGSSSGTVVVTPDGGLIVVGTSTGLFIVNAEDGSARTTVDLGTSSGSVTVTPDGAFALALGGNGMLYLVDIQPGSPTEGQARTSVDTGSTSGTVGVSPDGGFVFVTRSGRLVDVYRIVVLSGPAAVDRSGAEGEPFSFDLAQTLEVGENPVGLAFDPSGSGLVITANAGDRTISYINGPAAPLGVDEVAADTTGICISGAHPCATVPVVFNREGTAPARAISVTITLSPELELCDEPGLSIVQGDWLSGFATAFEVAEGDEGVYTVDQTILGEPCGVTTGGTLFTVDVRASGTASPDDIGTITVTEVELRDCGNPFATLPGDPGAPADLTIDHAAPAAVSDLAAQQVLSGNDGDGTTKISLSWSGFEAGATMDVYRKGYGFYPEYDDDGGSSPTAPVSPVAAEAAGWTAVAHLGGGGGYVDEPGTRDFWYYVSFVTDPCGNVSTVSNRTAGALNYHLGDLKPAETPPPYGDNQVELLDVSHLGNHYGTASGQPLYDAGLDIGPTADHSTRGLPVTDNRVQFEDLIIFAINFGGVSKPGRTVPDEATRNAVILEAAPRTEASATLDARIRLVSNGSVQGASIGLAWDPAVVEPVSVIPGDAAGAESSPAVVFSPAPGVVDAAALGAPFRGEIDLAVVRFHVKAPGDPALALAEVVARDRMNAAITLDREVTVGGEIPAVTRLRPAAPNPFRGTVRLSFDLAAAGTATLRIFAPDGRLVRTIVDAALPAGRHAYLWDGRDDAGHRIAAGIYLMRFTARDAEKTRRLVYIR